MMTPQLQVKKMNDSIPWPHFPFSPSSQLARISNQILQHSGLSDRTDGILLVFDRFEDLRDKLRLSVEGAVDSREREEEVADEKVLVLELLPKIELLFICSV
jgi:hypothetical protein